MSSDHFSQTKKSTSSRTIINSFSDMQKEPPAKAQDSGTGARGFKKIEASSTSNGTSVELAFFQLVLFLAGIFLVFYKN